MPKQNSPEQRWEEQVLEAVRIQMRGVHLDRALTPEEIAKRMLAVAPREQKENRLAQEVGPFYDTEGVRTWLGVSRQMIQKRRDTRTIIACKTAEGRFIYPVWQFKEDGDLLADLASVIKVLSGGIDDGWTWSLWLLTPSPGELDGKSAVDWLRDGGDVEPVLRLARNDAAAWAA